MFLLFKILVAEKNGNTHLPLRETVSPHAFGIEGAM